MLKLNVAYSKKVPAETNFSSQQYHCQIEVELENKPEQIPNRIHESFCMVRDAVEAEIRNAQQTAPTIQPPQLPPPQPQQYPQQQYVQQNGYPQQPVQQQNGYVQQQPIQQPQPKRGKQYRNNNSSASPKQVHYLLDLAKRAGWTVQQILQRCQIPNIEAIPSKTCSDLIQEFSGAVA